MSSGRAGTALATPSMIVAADQEFVAVRSTATYDFKQKHRRVSMETILATKEFITFVYYDRVTPVQLLYL